jgi:hypothetical protein
MADLSVEHVHRVPQIPARMFWAGAVLMAIDVLYFRHLEGADPGRTVRHGFGALAMVAVGVFVSRGVRKAYWVALVWSGVMAIVSWSGLVLMLLWDRAPFGERTWILGLVCGAAVWTTSLVSLLLRDTREAFLGRGTKS